MTAAGRPFSVSGRAQNLADLADRPVDVLVVGGGITGAGIAHGAAMRGYTVGLLEARDFASGTSSRSSKLVHGGIRYLGQGEVGLVHEALQERRRLAETFPDLVRPLPFLMPIPRSWPTAASLAAGFWMYDGLALGSRFPRHRRVSAATAVELAPALPRAKLRGAWKYWDAQTDDAALTVEVLRRAHARGALVANYVKVERAQRDGDGWRVDAVDTESGERFTARARHLVNAGGVWADAIESLAGESEVTHLRPSKGVHVAFARPDLPINVALIFPIGGGRVLFAIPWHGHVIVGTTDDDYGGSIDAPACTDDEAATMLDAVNRYFDLSLGPAALRSRWAGVRPLVAPREGGQKTKDLSRKPFIHLDANGLLTVTGGKLTTFMRMADDALKLLPPATGGSAGPDGAHPARVPAAEGDAGSATVLSEAAGYRLADVARAVEEEMALHLEDALSRRLRLSFLDTEAAASAAPAAAAEMAARLGWPETGAEVVRYEALLEREFGWTRPAGLAKPVQTQAAAPD